MFKIKLFIRICLFFLIYLTFLRWPVFSGVIIGLIVLRYVWRKLFRKTNALTKSVQKNTAALVEIGDQLGTMALILSHNLEKQPEDEDPNLDDPNFVIIGDDDGDELLPF